MERLRNVLFFLSVMLICATAGVAAEEPVFGPVKYGVKERYGKENRYSGTFTVAEGPYLIKFQNGEKLPDRPDWIEFSVNGEKLLPDAKYEHLFMACFVNLKKENTFEVVLKDDKPSGFRRPTPVPKFVHITVLPVPPAMKNIKGVLAINSWDGLKEYADAILKIKNPDALSFAMTAASLQNGTSTRAEAVRKLSDLKQESAQDFLLRLYTDYACVQDVRGEAALALGVLGDKKMVPILMQGILDAEEKVAIGSARALSFYKEEDTQGLLMKTLEQLDLMRKDAAVRSIVDAGWKPVSTIIKLAESKDPQVSGTALRLLGGMGDPRATDLLLKLLDSPGQHDVGVIITSLGQLKDPRAVEPLLKIVADPAKRKGKEAELGEALANLGDQRAVDPIIDMIKKADTRAKWDKLRGAYKKLTGKDYGK